MSDLEELDRAGGEVRRLGLGVRGQERVELSQRDGEDECGLVRVRCGGRAGRRPQDLGMCLSEAERRTCRESRDRWAIEVAATARSPVGGEEMVGFNRLEDAPEPA